MPLITPYEYALICLEAYEIQPKQELAGHWRLCNKQSLNNLGHSGVAYRHQHEKVIVIAHRGTEPNILQNLVTDSNIFLNRLPKSQQAAYEFSMQFRETFEDYTFIETGHSLGGFHAELNAAHFKCQVVTFDSPGCGEHVKHLKVDSKLFTGYLSAPNIINTAKPHLGQLIRLYPYHVQPEGHQLSNITSHANGQWIKMLPNLSWWPLVDTGSQLSSSFFSYEFQLHSLERILDQMDPETGYPWLQREITQWPLLADLLKVRLNPLELDTKAWTGETLSLTKQNIEQNQRYELACHAIKNYQLGEFLTPDLSHLTTPHSQGTKALFYRKALEICKLFHDDEKLIEQFRSKLPKTNPSQSHYSLAFWQPDNSQNSQTETYSTSVPETRCTIS